MQARTALHERIEVERKLTWLQRARRGARKVFQHRFYQVGRPPTPLPTPLP